MKEERKPPRACLTSAAKHAWRVVNPQQAPPKTLVCDKCGKHSPPQPTDSDYDTWVNE